MRSTMRCSLSSQLSTPASPERNEADVSASARHSRTDGERPGSMTA